MKRFSKCTINHLNQLVSSKHLQKIPEAFKNSQPVSLLKTTIMGKTADLTAVQKAIIDTLKQEGKTQKKISEQIGCS